MRVAKFYIRSGLFWLLLTTIIVHLMGCKKEIDPLPLPDENGYIWLRNVKSIKTIKNAILGNWKIHYTYGGLTGHERVMLDSSYFRYLPNDSLYLTIEGHTYVAGRTHWVYEQTAFGFNSWIMSYELANGWGLMNEIYPSIIYNDTLSIGQNSVDPISYNMTRLP